MLEVRLYEGKVPSAQGLFAALERIRGGRARVYHTCCENEERTVKYLLMTTSKDIHLELGCLPQDVLLMLCEFLDNGFVESGEEQILLYFKASRDAGGMLLTKSAESSPDKQTYNLSPVH